MPARHGSKRDAFDPGQMEVGSRPSTWPRPASKGSTPPTCSPTTAPRENGRGAGRAASAHGEERHEVSQPCEYCGLLDHWLASSASVPP